LVTVMTFGVRFMSTRDRNFLTKDRMDH